VRFVNIPPDCLFTVRFGGGTWHQFVPLQADQPHPALFAISCHSNELGGLSSSAQKQLVEANNASIPALTELLPAAVQAFWDSNRIDLSQVPVHQLSFHPAPGSSPAGDTAALDAPAAQSSATDETARPGISHRALAHDSLLVEHLIDAEHEDSVQRRLRVPVAAMPGSIQLMELLLEGFVCNPSPLISGLMLLRNQLVRPLGLRRSPLGCPVSTLLGKDRSQRFAGRFPVLAQRHDARQNRMEVILGADDKHLQFRSCVGVQEVAPGLIEFSLSTRVRTRNAFGRFYMTLIHRLHRRMIAPTMLQHATDYLLLELDRLTQR
jgi:hypothetical protein